MRLIGDRKVTAKNGTANSAKDQQDFCSGILYYGEAWDRFASLASEPVIGKGRSAIDKIDDKAVYQTLLGADALRYVTLQVCASKGSGHPGGFASSAEAHAALMMLGHTNIVTEVGHHAPGFYSSMFLDSSLEDMGIYTMDDMMSRFREKHGLLGHLSGAIPGLLAPAGPLGQGQHFAMAAAYLHADKLFPVTIGDGGMGEPYVLNSMMHFNTAYPKVTNFLPVLIWNGYSQEHHSMVSLFTNGQMLAYWQAHGFKEVIIVDAKDFDDSGQTGAYVDSSRFSLTQRLAFTKAVLQGMEKAASSALSGTLTAFIIKQLKGSGVHTLGAKSHNLYPADTLDQAHIIEGLKRRALPKSAFSIVRENFRRAGGGPAGKTAVTEKELSIIALPTFNFQEFSKNDKAVPATAMGALVAQLGKADSRFVVTNADGNEASAMKNINEALKIRHPSEDALYNQAPNGQVYEPLNEDACAGFAAGLALFGSRSLWLSYESFAINGWPIIQTVTQAMAELRRKTPAIVTMFTAGALEQGRNGWTHQRPEIESYFAAMMRNGNVYPMYPCDANSMQICYEYAVNSYNKGMIIIASKSPLPIRIDLQQSRQAVEDGATIIYQSDRSLKGGHKGQITFAVTGDMVLLPVFEAKDKLEQAGYNVRIVSVINPRRLYRPDDIAWNTVAEPDGQFLSDEKFEQLFSADVLIGVSGGPSAALEPVMLRSQTNRRDMFCWKRGETTASPGEIMAYNGITADQMVERATKLINS